MSAVIVGNLLLLDLPSVLTREFTLENGLMSVASVGRPSLAASMLFGIRKFTTQKGLMSADGAGEPSAVSPILPSTRKYTLGKGLMYAGNVGTSLLTDLFHYLRFHTESRPFECGECGKPFRWRSVAPAVLESSHWITAL